MHVSNLDWTNKTQAVEGRLCSATVEVMILEIDVKTVVASRFGIKQCQPNPWDEVRGQLQEAGDKVSGAIQVDHRLYVFIGLPGGIDGLIRSDLSWTIAGEQAVRDFKKGQEWEAAVLGAFDVERTHLAGHQTADGDPFNNYIALKTKGRS